MSNWTKSVDENRATIEKWADSDLPLAEEMRTLLREADAAKSTDSGATAHA